MNLNFHPKVKAAAVAATIAQGLQLASVALGALPHTGWELYTSEAVAALVPLVAAYQKGGPATLESIGLRLAEDSVTKLRADIPVVVEQETSASPAPTAALHIVVPPAPAEQPPAAA